jgi:hypothetical protein
VPGRPGRAIWPGRPALPGSALGGPGLNGGPGGPGSAPFSRDVPILGAAEISRTQRLGVARGAERRSQGEDRWYCRMLRIPSLRQAAVSGAFVRSPTGITIQNAANAAARLEESS